MKILWLSNYRFSAEPIKATGTWLKVMGEQLAEQNEVEFINITTGSVSMYCCENYNNIKQYVFPRNQLNFSNIQNNNSVTLIGHIIEEFQPDLIHVWGTELSWGLLTKNYVNRFKVLLEIQGLLTQILQQYFGGLSFAQILHCTGFKEVIKPNTHIIYEYNLLKKSSLIEHDIIKRHTYIGVQSEWTHQSIKSINNDAKIFKSLIPLRSEFTSSCGTWTFQGSGKIFVSASSLHSFKGIHIAIECLNIIIQSGINASLNIAGSQTKGLRQSGYKRFINHLIKKYKLESSITWLGALDACQLVSELQSSDAVLIPSFIESYCLTLYESLCIGTPLVCSYAGAMPEAGHLNSEIKYFQPGDYLVAANHLSQIITRSSSNTKTKPSFVSSENAVNRQLSIYRDIIER